MKIASSGVLHKSDVGGVRLDVEPSDAGALFDEMRRGCPTAEGVLVGPMRYGGVELLVGVVTDPAWGQVLSVGLGGVWVELLGDVALRLLPVDETDVASMLAELKAAPLLLGARGTRPVDVDRLAEVIVSVSRLAESLRVDTLEINPLRADGDTIEVLDALAVWNQ
jgi:acyl-CoA synthetase (NDP forming)